MFQNGKKTILKNSIRKINATKERAREKSKFESPCRSRWRRHMLVLTLIARTTLLSPSAAHRQPPRPISFSTPAYRFPFHAAPCRFLPCFHRVIPIFLRRCPPLPHRVLREYNIQEGRKRKFVQRTERPMAEEEVGFVKYGKGCGQEAEKL